MLPVLVNNNFELTYESFLELSIRRHSKNHYLLDEVSRNVLNYFTNCFRSDSQESFEILRLWMNKHEHFPALEFIWWLHHEHLLLVPTYFYLNQPYCEYFYEVFEEIYSLSPEENVQYQFTETVLSTILAALLNTLQHPDDGLQLFVNEVVNVLINKIVDMVERNVLTGNPLAGLKNHFYYNEDSLRDFAYLQLKYLLSLPTKFSVNTVVEIHTKKWTWSFISEVIKEYVNQVLSLIPAKKVIEEISGRTNEITFNWEYTFIIISVMINNMDCSAIIKASVDSWLKKAFEEDEVTSILYVATLVARHCCYEKARYFQSYANWFSSLNFKNSKSFSLFFKFLTEILPYEPPLFLKIHLNKVPSAPYGCQSLLVDYILLAKTRLSDLNETEEYIGLFNDYHETTKDGQEADVARVIKHYIDNKEIVKPLLEAYILRRQYYEKVFLKQLLKVAERDDGDRAQLIYKLNSMGKVPSSLFNAWTKL